MNNFRFTAFLAEFSFLEDILRQDDGQVMDSSKVTSISVKRWTPELLNSIPQEWHYTGSLIDNHVEQKVNAILQDDNEVYSDFVEQAYESKSNYAYTQPHYGDGETILDAINKKIRQDIKFLVMTESIVDNSELEFKITIYKPAQDIVVSDLIAIAREKATKEVEAEIAF